MGESAELERGLTVVYLARLSPALKNKSLDSFSALDPGSRMRPFEWDRS